mmetsp:Transcript_32547/g.50904  ORF Transcript_32547/g.50904 Transcript_32547/m.50904 type:complete len:97 (-) Transcript_32547:79-369(-)|eukprot:CAMPEP_0201519726 /NCGR_PEP_ID=MMETSP0161_2-20130828/10203_1 /ASSEMBLY_ACC=CAM_ASM_000251 /TAXON_ID=180227 /ORGANISM="Neoparamoeba aestuarina, Strain SoJaBio B1-5/56/2" /LENGTH=96 /DNA_ID=CAMNT_0047917849 /DNA_START=53 /DNA_END=343 /DNA_ORIENTATION=-
MSVYERVHDTGVPSHQVQENDDDDEWETDPEPANLVSPQEQRWGAKTLPQDKKEFQDMKDLRQQVINQHKEVSEAEYYAKGRAEEYQTPGQGQSTD